MAWADELVPTLRTYINDVKSPQTYTDAILTTHIVLAADRILRDSVFSKNYQVDVVNETISPDPTSDPFDKDFVVLLILKASCILANNKLDDVNDASNVTAQLGPILFQTKVTGQDLSKFKNKTYCEIYDEAMFEYRLERLESYYVVLTPANIVIHVDD